MVLRSKRRFTNISVLEDLNDFSEMKQMDIFYEVSIKINYCYQDYKNDQKRINTFLEFGNRENLKKYLEFAENVVNSNFEEMNEYWLLFASAKLFFCYGDVIKDYHPMYQVLLSSVYMYTPIDRISISEDILLDSGFYMKESFNGRSYSEMFNMLKNEQIAIELAYDEDIELDIEGKEKLLH